MARTDPYKNFRFLLEIDGLTQAGFSDCSGFGSDVEVVEYREGGDAANDNLQDFLSGLEGFATDMDGYYKNTDKSVDVESISWRMVAEMLLAATVYE